MPFSPPSTRLLPAPRPLAPAAHHTRAAAPGSGLGAALWIGGLLLLATTWDHLGWDMALARWAGGQAGFAGREHWLLEGLLHRGGRGLAWAAALALCLGVWWPWGPLRRLALSRRLQLAGSTLLAVALVALLKSASPAPCPWDLAEFGGLAQAVSHWDAWARPGAGGHCFPAGHASAGFAFVSGWFVFREAAPALARAWLGTALACGLLLGLAQQWRGAHFMSHTLWAAVLCAVVAWLCDGLHRRLAATGLATAVAGADADAGADA
ncbi:phosphatase PAP2 family protein [Aquabacterium sp. OR-4]|uniref:phosphatase PAP2 family protein n=1 Tax=Aquabacterium sp. OR-4 TaxID=2978127 RepID=UPI0028C8108C|nr:phosphatase PAP2 family protein [Aquabacterium sp. OR-4]MDT7834300.1 phosphatase PAP2 family protein [Aquabacterium sp. OR-4]